MARIVTEEDTVADSTMAADALPVGATVQPPTIDSQDDPLIHAIIVKNVYGMRRTDVDDAAHPCSDKLSRCALHKQQNGLRKDGANTVRDA